MSRAIEDLTPETQAVYYKFKMKMAISHIDYIVTCTKRTELDQLELYKKGREFKDGKWVVVEPKRCVTWTLKSNHLTGKAFDILIMINGKPLWNAELDVDKDGIAEYTEAGIIGESVGLRWGGRFKTGLGKPIPDAPHFELT
jgi:peptidoglycan L-alanyl-D-glutamate endopeptidase CwlK